MYSILARPFKTKTKATSRTSYLKTLNPTSMSIPFSAQITHIADPKGAQTTDHPHRTPEEKIIGLAEGGESGIDPEKGHSLARCTQALHGQPPVD